MVEHFKNELRNYKFYTSLLSQLEDKLDETYYELAGVKAIQYDKLPSGFNKQFIEEKRYALSSKIENYEKQISRLSSQVQYIEDILSNMDDDIIRNAIIEVYINGKNIKDVGNKIGYTDAGLFYQMSKVIKEAIGGYYE